MISIEQYMQENKERYDTLFNKLWDKIKQIYGNRVQQVGVEIEKGANNLARHLGKEVNESGIVDERINLYCYIMITAGVLSYNDVFDSDRETFISSVDNNMSDTTESYQEDEYDEEENEMIDDTAEDEDDDDYAYEDSEESEDEELEDEYEEDISIEEAVDELLDNY